MKLRWIILLGLLFIANSVYSWYYPEWDYRVPITIQENSGNDLYDYQVMLTVSTANLIFAGKMRSDCGDIRFTYMYPNGTEVEIPYWIERCENRYYEISVEAYYGSGTTCPNMNNFPSTPNSYGSNDWYTWDPWSCDNCDWYVRIYLNFTSNLPREVLLEVRSNEGQTIWINGNTVGSCGGNSSGVCHTIGSCQKTWNLTNYITYNNEIRIWCSESIVGEYCYFRLIVDGQEIRYNGNYSSPNSTIWIKVPYIPANGNVTVYMYYGNPNVQSLSDPYNVFEFFDDFEGTSIDTNKWEIVNPSAGTISLSNGILTIGSTGDWWEKSDTALYIVSKKAFNFDYIAETHVVQIGPDNYNRFFGLRSSPATNAKIFVLLYDSDKSHLTVVYREADGVDAIYFGDDKTIPNPGRGGVYKLIRIGDCVKAYFEATFIYEMCVSNWNLIYVALTDTHGTANPSKFDWIRVRKYAPVEPTYSFGTEQIGFSFEITNKRLNEYVSLVNVTYEIFSALDTNVTLEFYLNNNLVDTREYFIQALQTLHDYYTYVIEKEGNHTIKIVANFIDYNKVREDSFTFTLDFYPPILIFVDNFPYVIDITPTDCITYNREVLCVDSVNRTTTYDYDYIRNNVNFTDKDLFVYLFATNNPRNVAIDFTNLSLVETNLSNLYIVCYGCNPSRASTPVLYVNNTTLIYIRYTKDSNIPTGTKTVEKTFYASPYDIVLLQEKVPIFNFYTNDKKIISGLKVSYVNKSNYLDILSKGPWKVYNDIQYYVKDYNSFALLQTYSIPLGQITTITIDIQNYSLRTKSFVFEELKYILANETPYLQLLSPHLDVARLLRVYVTPAGYYVYLLRRTADYHLVDFAKSQPTASGELIFIIPDMDYLRFEFYDQNGNLVYHYEDIISGNDYVFNLPTETQNGTTYSYAIISEPLVMQIVKSVPPEFNPEQMTFEFNLNVTQVEVFYLKNNTWYKKEIQINNESIVTLRLIDEIDLTDVKKVFIVFTFYDNRTFWVEYDLRTIQEKIIEILQKITQDVIIKLIFLLSALFGLAVIFSKTASEYFQVAISIFTIVLLGLFGVIPWIKALGFAMIIFIAAAGMIKFKI